MHVSERLRSLNLAFFFVHWTRLKLVVWVLEATVVLGAALVNEVEGGAKGFGSRPLLLHFFVCCVIIFSS